MVTEYIPDQGDIIWTNFDPQVGHEQAGTRPALVLSNRAANKSSGLAVCCPITGRRKGYNFEVPLPRGLEVYGVVLVDQIRSIDWRARQVVFQLAAPESLVDRVLDSLDTLLD